VAEDRDGWAPRSLSSGESARRDAARNDAARERRLTEWEADLARRERDLGNDPESTDSDN